MKGADSQGPFTLLEGTDPIGTFASKAALFSAVEPLDLDNYVVVDRLGHAYTICRQGAQPGGLFDAFADAVGAPVALTLVLQPGDGGD